MKQIIQIAAYLILLVGTLVFGYMGKPAEMGLAIVAASIALVFSDIDRFKRVKGAGFEAEMREQVAAVLEKQIEAPAVIDSEATSPMSAQITGVKKIILSSLNHPEFTWRYLSGLMNETKKPRDEILVALQWLVENGFARKSHGKHGDIWSLTEEGRYIDVIDDFDILPNPAEEHA